jgi:hypothetical protein
MLTVNTASSTAIAVSPTLAIPMVSTPFPLGSMPPAEFHQFQRSSCRRQPYLCEVVGYYYESDDRSNGIYGPEHGFIHKNGAMLLQALYSIRSERQLMERLEFNLLFFLVRRDRRRRCGVPPSQNSLSAESGICKSSRNLPKRS